MKLPGVRSERFENLRNLVGLLKKMAHDLALDLARRKNRMVPNGLKMASGSERCNFEGFLYFDKERFWRVLGDIVTTSQFKMIEARYKRGLFISQCAQVEGVTTGTVKWHLHDSFQRMKSETFFSTFSLPIRLNVKLELFSQRDPFGNEGGRNLKQEKNFSRNSK